MDSLNDYDALVSEQDNKPPAAVPKGEQISLDTIKAWHREAVTAELKYRDRLEDDRRILNGDPWDAKQRQVFKQRKQLPLAINHIRRDVMIQLGRQIKAAMMPVAKPRGGGDGRKARAYTDLFKYYWDANGATFEQSLAVLDQLVYRGWLRYGFQNDDLTREAIAIEWVPSEEMHPDPRHKRTDMRDAAHLFRDRWVETDSLIAQYPDKKAAIQAEAGKGSERSGKVKDADYNPADGYRDVEDGLTSGAGSIPYATKDRKRVRVVECWYKRTVRATQLRWPDGRSEVLDPNDQRQMQRLQADPSVEVVEGPVKQVYYVIFCGDVILAQGASPYKHNHFPYVPYPAFRANVTEETEVLCPGEPFGMIRVGKDPERARNMAVSKAIHTFSTTGGLYKKGQVNKEDLIANAAKPDGWTAVNEMDAVQPWDKTPQANAMLQLIPILNESLEAGTGVNEASRGMGPEQSGRAMMARQNQSETANMVLVDNQRQAIQLGGWILMSLIQQTVRGEKIVRITEDAGDRTIAINVNDPQRAAELQAQGHEVVGSIWDETPNIIVDEAPADPTRQESDNEILMQIMQMLGPMGGPMLADLVVENLQSRNKEQLMERISQIQQMMGGGGQPDPMQQQAMMQAQQAQDAKTQADAQKSQAQAENTQADTALKAQQLQHNDARLVMEASDQHHRQMQETMQPVGGFE